MSRTSQEKYLVLFCVCFLGLFLLILGKNIATVETLRFIPEEVVVQEALVLPEEPVRLEIPRLHVDAVVQHVGLSDTGNGEMGIPSNFTDVGWYQYGPRPGMEGSAVIAGHFNGKNVKEAVFYDLGTLEIGDEVLVTDAEKTVFTFRVTGKEMYAYTDATEDIFFNTENRIGLNLITCAGDWLRGSERYDKRVVVFTEFVHVTQ